jgi:hypothetical protein
MHTIVVTMSVDPERRLDAVTHLQRDVAPWATKQAGFVSGHWLATPDGKQGLGVISFETLEQAELAARGPRSYQRDEQRAWNVEQVDVFEQVAQAAI